MLAQWSVLRLVEAGVLLQLHMLAIGTPSEPVVIEGFDATPRLSPTSKIEQSVLRHLANPPPDAELVESHVPPPVRLGAMAITGRPSGVIVTEVRTAGSPELTACKAVITGVPHVNESQTAT